MEFKEILPGEKLRPYVKCYFIIESELDVEFADTIFPGGHIEIVFNLGDAVWRSSIIDGYQTDPPIELLGQITRPMFIKSRGKNMMLGIRFFPHTAAYFLGGGLDEFNNQISDLRDLLGGSVRTLHSRLMEVQALNQRIELIERFLFSRLSISGKKLDKATMIGQIVKEMQGNAFSDNIETIALRYGITSRYLQKLFLQHIGVTPKVYSSINRFQRTLKHINRKEVSLTLIAYECGYADQSHFIREFRSFTGVTPSLYLPQYSPVNQLFTK
jgi:AraC-like DNA-binding protein